MASTVIKIETRYWEITANTQTITFTAKMKEHQSLTVDLPEADELRRLIKAALIECDY